MTEQYCLRWNNHQSTVISVFENLLESGSLIDCTLCAEGKLLKAHKVVLSACSSVFESMLCQHGGDKHPIIFLKDVRYEEMKAMLDYMYKGEANVHQELLDSFLKTAASLQIKGLTDQGGGGGTDEPPPKKGPGVNANRSKPPPPLDATPESSREGSISPTMSRKRRRPTTNNMAGSGGVRRPSSEDASADNSCDTLPLSSAQNVSAAPPYQATPSSVVSTPSQPLPQSSQSLMEPARVTIKKQEPLDQTPQSMIQPKTEFIDESNEDVEDLTLDDDDDYNDSMSEMSKPGTSYSMQQPSQDFQWSQMMGGNDSRSGAEEVFMQQDSVNNQGNTQGSHHINQWRCSRGRG